MSAVLDAPRSRSIDTSFDDVDLGPRNQSARTWRALSQLPAMLAVTTSSLIGLPAWTAVTGTAVTYVAPSVFTTSPGTSVSSRSAQMKTTATRVDELRAQSGLTTDQIARLMGVSRRSVHNWLVGGSMSAANEERLAQLQEVVNAIPGDSTERRAILLDSSHGRSRFHQLLEELPRWAVAQPEPLTTSEQMGV